MYIGDAPLVHFDGKPFVVQKRCCIHRQRGVSSSMHAVILLEGIRLWSARLRRALARGWRKFIGDEDPEERRERIRRERIKYIVADVAMLEAMRRWEIENKKRTSKAP